MGDETHRRQSDGARRMKSSSRTSSRSHTTSSSRRRSEGNSKRRSEGSSRRRSEGSSRTKSKSSTNNKGDDDRTVRDDRTTSSSASTLTSRRLELDRMDDVSGCIGSTSDRKGSDRTQSTAISSSECDDNNDRYGGDIQPRNIMISEKKQENSHGERSKAPDCTRRNSRDMRNRMRRRSSEEPNSVMEEEDEDKSKSSSLAQSKEQATISDNSASNNSGSAARRSNSLPETKEVQSAFDSSNSGRVRGRSSSLPEPYGETRSGEMNDISISSRSSRNYFRRASYQPQPKSACDDTNNSSATLNNTNSGSRSRRFLRASFSVRNHNADASPLTGNAGDTIGASTNRRFLRASFSVRNHAREENNAGPVAAAGLSGGMEGNRRGSNDSGGPSAHRRSSMFGNLAQKLSTGTGSRSEPNTQSETAISMEEHNRVVEELRTKLKQREDAIKSLEDALQIQTEKVNSLLEGEKRFEKNIQIDTLNKMVSFLQLDTIAKIEEEIQLIQNPNMKREQGQQQEEKQEYEREEDDYKEEQEMDEFERSSHLSHLSEEQDYHDVEESSSCQEEQDHDYVSYGQKQQHVHRDGDSFEYKQQKQPHDYVSYGQQHHHNDGTQQQQYSSNYGHDDDSDEDDDLSESEMQAIFAAAGKIGC